LQDIVRPVSITLERRLQDATAVVTLAGEVDLRFNESLKAILTQEVDDGHNLIVDLSSVDFLDSTGLGLFVGVLKRAEERARRLGQEPTKLILVITAREVWRTLKVTNLDHVFTIVDRVEDAECLI
jgi:anti-sigma B factor antagonist